MIEMNQLEQFIAIYQAGTISKAAEELHISQPALTRSIQKLEESLGLQLFDRKKNKIELNDNGMLALQYVQKIIDDKNEMIIQHQRFDRSHHMISIGSCAPAPEWALTSIFNRIYPNINVTNEVISNEETLLDGLRQYKYSIIVLNHPIYLENYQCIELFEEFLYLSVPLSHPLVQYNEISFQQLDGQSILLLSRIGFWNEICLKMLPQSHLLFQEDYTVLNELTKYSEIPYFNSNITIQQTNSNTNRKLIPITDQIAHTHYYAIFSNNQQNLFKHLKNEINAIDWNQILQKVFPSQII